MHEDTFRQWAWFFITEVSYLEAIVILWSNRKKRDIRNVCLASVDGVDFRVKGKKLMSGKPDKRYYSFKFKGPALRYLIAMSVHSTDMVYLDGPYLPGVYNDL